MTRPIRIQRKRTKGWRMPDNAVYVGRGTVFGNPFTLTYMRTMVGTGETDVRCAMVELFREWLMGTLHPGFTDEKPPTPEQIASLRGKDLACWCKPGDPCHADILLELANKAAP